MFGRPDVAPQHEASPFDPQNPYAVAKLFGHQMGGALPEGFDLFAVSGILYNHESPRRGLDFVTRKITNAVARIALGLDDQVVLGDLDARRDWGFAGDYVRAMWLMLQQDTPESYVIASGTLRSVREVAEIAFAHAQLDWQDHVVVDDQFRRRDDVAASLVGDASRAREHLGWQPEVELDELIQLMVEADLARLDPDQEYGTQLDWPSASRPVSLEEASPESR